MNLEGSRRVRDAYTSLLGDVGAFLPDRVPVDCLAEPLQIYLDTCAELVGHYPAPRGGVRQWLDERFARFNPEWEDALLRLNAIESWTLLTALVVLGHTYRWDCVPPKPERFAEHTVPLPDGIGVPWSSLSARMGQPRVGTMWTFHLCNWRLEGKAGGSPYQPSDLTIDRLHVRHQWLEPPTSNGLERFSLSFVLTEARGANVVRAIVDAIEAAAREDIQETSFRLDLLQDSIHEMSKAFIQINKDTSVDPQEWLQLIQPTWVWTNEGDLPGPNGMDLPTLQCIDAALDIPENRTAAQQFQTAAYMPEAHRQFVGIIGELRKVIRGIVDKSDSLILHRRYNDCIRAVRKFRIAHRVRGARYLNAGKYGTSGHELQIVESLAQPIREFEHRMNDRIADTESALLLSDARTEYPSVESTFRFLSLADRALLIETAPCKSFGVNEVIMRQGDRRQALYVIKEGFVRIETAASQGRSILARLWPGEVFGEASFLTNAEATATVIADEKVAVYVLDRTHVYAVIGESPELAKRFYQSLAVQLANRLRDADALIAALSRV